MSKPARYVVLHTRLSDEEAAALDQASGGESRSAVLRRLVLAWLASR